MARTGRPPEHGASYTREYAAWSNMRARCENPNDKQWPRYGGRGIAVCARWACFQAFIADMGPSNGLTIERKDVNGDYTPDNCEWATMKTQQNNKRNTRRVTINGQTKSLAQWCDHHGIRFGTAAARWSRGLRDERLFAPPGQYLTKATGNRGNRFATGSPPGFRHTEAAKAKIGAASSLRHKAMEK